MSPSRRIAWSGRIAAVTLLGVCLGCEGRREEEGTTLPEGSPPAETTSVPASATLVDIAQRHFDAVPDSVLMRTGACPFECCVYGEWRADSPIPLLAEPENDAAAVDTLRATERFRARSGYVEVLGPAIVVVMDTVRDDPDNLLAFVPGDTLVVLDYVGEGFWNVWHENAVHQISGFWGAEVDSPKGAYYGDYRREWWVNAESPRGRSGWFRADLDVELSGVDACGTPI